MKLYGETITDEDRASSRLGDQKCAEKAFARNQQTFTLVEQDLTSPETICYWIMRNIATAPPAKLYDALRAAIIMRESTIPKKNAD